MTFRIKIEHLKEDSDRALAVSYVGADRIQIIRPGGSAHFWIDTREIRITTISNKEKKGETA